MQRLCMCVIGLLLLLAAGCEPGTESVRGLRLPDGNIAKGKAAFVSLKCYNCHPVDGVELPAPEQADAPQVVLGGQFYHVKTRGDLAASILDPSYKLAAGYKRETISRDGASLMPGFNHTLSVEQMIDLVAFLQSRYIRIEPETWAYH